MLGPPQGRKRAHLVLHLGSKRQPHFFPWPPARKPCRLLRPCLLLHFQPWPFGALGPSCARFLPESLAFWVLPQPPHPAVPCLARRTFQVVDDSPLLCQQGQLPRGARALSRLHCGCASWLDSLPSVFHAAAQGACAEQCSRPRALHLETFLVVPAGSRCSRQRVCGGRPVAPRTLRG